MYKIPYSHYVDARVIEIAQYIVDNRTTVRETAKEFGVSKSTVHKDIKSRLEKLDMRLKEQVDEVINYHLKVRHMRGGMATKTKSKIS